MKRKFVLLLLSITFIIVCVLSLAACNSASGTYYLVNREGEVEMTSYIKLDGKNWENNEGMSGTYEIKDQTITFYVELFGEKTEWNSGSYKDGIIKIDSYLAGKQTYVSENHKHSYSEWEKEREANCVEDGLEVRSCACGIKEHRTFQPALGHKWSEWEIISDATCTVEGEKSHTCERCDRQENVTIIKDHEFDGWDFNETKHFRNCLVGGEYYEEEHSGNGVCEVCKYKYGDTVGLKYTILDNTNTYVVTGIGTAADTEIKIPSIYKERAVTGIRMNAFRDCTSLTSITIPDSVTEIDSSAFINCSSLTSITVGENNLNYRSVNNCILSKDGTRLILGCNNSTIPNGITSIGDYAFRGCSSLTSITIPDSVTSIGIGAFYGCSSLTSISIPEGVAEIGTSAFSNCTSITSVTIPDSVTEIGSNAFNSCPIETATIPAIACSKIRNSELKTVVITGGESIATNAFYNCTSLTSITIPDGVTSIGSSAFSGCTSLTSITIPDGVTSIGSSAFSGCSSLTSIDIPNGVTSIGSSAFSDCTSLTSITIPDSVTSIADYAFYRCSSLTSINIPDSVTSIGIGAFDRCSSLTSINIPDGVTSIDTWAFSSCSSLTSVTIPDSVTKIDTWAFDGCSSLTSITFNGTVAQWRQIKKDRWDNGMDDYTIHCTDGEITKSGKVTMY